MRPADADFPSVLSELTDRLWLRGQASALTLRPRITIVGSRAASARGLARAYQLGRALGARGALVISGGAVGIDAAAHEGALAGGGRTCAVLGTGIDRIYPARHADLFEAIAQRGCLLSRLDPGTQPIDWHFPQRNQLMAALADTVIVVEAQVRSGTQSTAIAARRQGRQVLCFPDSPGTQRLAQTGATAVSSVGEVLGLLGLSGLAVNDVSDLPIDNEPTDLPPLSHDAQILVGVLSKSPLDLGELCARAGLLAAECAAALIDLELRGQCSRLPGGRYIGHSPLS